MDPLRARILVSVSLSIQKLAKVFSWVLFRSLVWVGYGTLATGLLVLPLQMLRAQTASSGAVISLPTAFTQPYGVAVDIRGNVFVADTFDNAVKEIPAGCTSSSSCVQTLAVGFSFKYPTGVAVDASGNVFVADSNNNAVEEILAGCTSNCVITLGGGFSQPVGVAVDRNDNIFVADSWNSAVKEIPPRCSSASCVATLGGGFSFPSGIAVDATGNVIVTDTNNNLVKKMAASCASASCVTTLASGFTSPWGIAVDGNGNIFFTNTDATTGHGVVNEIPAGCVSNSCVSWLIPQETEQARGVAVDASGNVFVADSSLNEIEESMVGSRFPATAVGSASSTLSFYFTFHADGQIGASRVLTQGVTGLEFADAGTGSCTTNFEYIVNDICTVDVQFKPTHPGQGLGAVELTTTLGSPIATAYASGVGTGPQVIFSSNNMQTALGGGFNQPASVVVDASGNVFVADTYNSAVKEIPAGCASSSCVTTLGGGFSYPTGVAVDGSGNVFVADFQSNAVKEIRAGCLSSSCVWTLGGGFSEPESVAVDGSGDIFVADIGNSAVKRMPASCASSSCVTTLNGGFVNPHGVAVDASDNLFVADFDNSSLKEMPAGCSSSSCVTTLGGGLNGPNGVAVDASGNLFVADTENSAVKEIPVGCTSFTCVVTLGDGFNYPVGLAVDGSGNVFVADSYNNAVKKLDFSDAPSLAFASTNVGSTSTDSPQTVTMANDGNTDLNFLVPTTGTNPAVSTNFVLDSSSAETCPLLAPSSAPETLAPGASCTLPMSFAPLTPAGFTGSLTITDNNLNATAAPGTMQVITLSGTGIAVVPSVTTAAITSITQTTANGGGNVNSGYGALVTARGVCWSASTNPTTANTCTADGTGTGRFTSSITGLTANTGYHVRAYATNSAGTAYGSDAPFTTLGSADFQMGAVSGGSLSATVTAGSSATYNLAVTPANGFTGTVTLSCSGLPTSSNCSASPVSVSGSAAVPFTLTISTTSRTTMAAGITNTPPFTGRGSMPASNLAIVLLVGIVAIGGGTQRRRWMARAAGLLIVAAVGLAGCGSNQGTTKTITTGTPAGTYSVVLTATSGSLSHSVNLTLTVN